MLTATVRALFVILLLLSAPAAHAQTGAGSQDSSVTGQLRPRWGAYLVGAFPSPAKAGESVTVQVYNHTDVTLECRVFDGSGRIVLVLQPKQMTPAGLHNFTITPFQLTTGGYLVQLVTYTPSGSPDVVDYVRFAIIH